MGRKQNGSRNPPPVETRWKKGESGNPAGRPKKAECLTSLLKEEIEKIPKGDKEGRTWAQLVVLATLSLAVKGHGQALKEVWQRIDGRAPLEIDLGALKAEVTHKLGGDINDRLERYGAVLSALARSGAAGSSEDDGPREPVDPEGAH